MTGSAQLEIEVHDPLEAPAPPSAELPSTLKLQMAERVAAHRRRKLSSAAAPANPRTSSPQPQSRGRRADLAATIAERYAQTPSYRAILAEQAQRAIEEAAAAADVAIRSAHAVQQAQQSLLAELELWTAPQAFTAAAARTAPADPASSALSVRFHDEPAQRPPVALHTNAERTLPAPDSDEAWALDEEIAFRQSPVFEEFNRSAEPPVPLAANLLEFPRQLVATRKARPRIAEGPLLEDSKPRTPQLRIFEVEAEQFAAPPALAAEFVPPAHSFIYLDSEPLQQPAAHPSAASAAGPTPASAPISRRLTALTMDAALVAAAVGAFAITARKVAGALPTGINAGITAAASLAVFWVLYQLLFFTLSHQTPGMRLARIGLCTLSDENPSRIAMRRRVLAQSLALLPFGIGMLWALLDDDRLGWHDRLSHMYQRAY